MMYKAIYRLGEYRITEYENGQLWWETHVALGEQRRGKCFIHGDVLIIGHWSHEESGYLIREFFEQLQKLPAWNKTRYFCFASNLLDVVTGQSLTNDFLEKRLSLVNMNSAGLKSDISDGPRTFRLGQYQITVTANSEVTWQTYGGFNRIIGGKCVIESDILFIGSQEYDEEGQSKQEFLSKLHQLPQWDKTMAWCRSLALRACQHQQQTERPAAPIQPKDTWDDRSLDEKPAATWQNRYEETPKRLPLSSFNWLKKSWHCVCEKKVWLKYLIPLVVVGLLFGLVMILHSVDEKLHWTHWFKEKEHHHKHNDHR
ncbi:MAG: hypothetical protein OEW69_05050 [Nitrospirota bacterium]|nr:hypothetical protein [Nitrospirota bacterium]